MDIGSIILGLVNADRLRRVVDYFKHFVGQKSKAQEAALRAIYDALNETQLYWSRHEHGQTNRETEEQLTRLWANAALALRNVDKDLAERCLEKGWYWSNSDIRTEIFVERHRIGLSDMFEEVRKLLLDTNGNAEKGSRG